MIKAGVCHSWKREVIRGEHRPDHTYKIALYTNDADLSPATTAYTRNGEVSGLGYEAGGVRLTGFSVSGGTTACLDFDDVLIPRSTLSVDGCLIYNETLNKAVYVGRFAGTVTSTNGPFTIDMPKVGEGSSLIRIA